MGLELGWTQRIGQGPQDWEPWGRGWSPPGITGVVPLQERGCVYIQAAFGCLLSKLTDCRVPSFGNSSWK